MLEGVADRMRKGLTSSDKLEARAAAEGVLEWSRLERAGKIPPAPQDLYGEIAGAVLLRRSTVLMASLAVARELIDHNRFSDADLARLAHGLAYLSSELDYDSPGAPDVDHLGLLRQMCVQLADALKTCRA